MDIPPADPQPRSQILEDLVNLVSRARQESHTFLEQYGVTVPQCGVLRVLQHGGSQPIGNLSSRLFLSMSTVSGIVDRLERAGLVARERALSDRRVVQVGLTAAGVELCERLPETPWERLARAVDTLPPSEALPFLATLQKILNCLMETSR